MLSHSGATGLSHESYRDGRIGPNQQSETRESVRAHWRYQDVLARGRHGRAYVGALDRDQALDFVVGRLYQQGIIGEEDIQKYIDGNYDSSSDFWRVIKRDKDGNIIAVEADGSKDLNDEKKNIILSEKQLKYLLFRSAYDQGKRSNDGMMEQNLGNGVPLKYMLSPLAQANYFKQQGLGSLPKNLRRYETSVNTELLKSLALTNNARAGTLIGRLYKENATVYKNKMRTHSLSESLIDSGTRNDIRNRIGYGELTWGFGNNPNQLGVAGKVLFSQQKVELGEPGGWSLGTEFLGADIDQGYKNGKLSSLMGFKLASLSLNYEHRSLGKTRIKHKFEFGFQLGLGFSQNIGGISLRAGPLEYSSEVIYQR